ncbi:MAG: hypothetical protein Q7R52_00150 [archaeon]|nr:hypothetical protein [archaeon]
MGISVIVLGENKMGLKHLIIIEHLFKNNPDEVFSQSHFTNYMDISYNTALSCLQYLWEQKKIELTPRGYRWKKKKE